MYCKNCGSEINNKAKFCNKCGEEINITPIEDNETVFVGTQKNSDINNSLNFSEMPDFKGMSNNDLSDIQNFYIPENGKQITKIRKSNEKCEQSIIRWILDLIIQAVPVIGLFMLVAWVLEIGNKSIKNFANAALIIRIVIDLVVAGIVIYFMVADRTVLDNLLNNIITIFAL